jgi:hypothetical protein
VQPMVKSALKTRDTLKIFLHIIQMRPTPSFLVSFSWKGGHF